MADIYLNVDIDNVDVSFDVESTVDVDMELDNYVTIQQTDNPYEGSYVVTPILEDDQIMETSGKTMLDDVTIKAIPVRKTRNSSGGFTIFVAESEE